MKTRVYSDALKCLGFNHKAEECKNEMACGKCAGKHKFKNCQSSEVKCINCFSVNTKLNLTLDTAHVALDIQCPVFIKKMEQNNMDRSFIIYMNSQSYVAHKEEIEMLVVNKNPVVLCLSETRTTEDIGNNEISIENYNIILCNASTDIRGVF